MGFPVVRQGFCGCSLKTSALFIAWWSLVTSFLGLLAMGFVGFSLTDEFSHQPEETAIPAGKFAEIITFVTMAIILFLIIFNVILIVGIYKENHCLMFPYICIKTTLLLLAILGAVQISMKGRFMSHNFGTLIYAVLDGFLVFMLFSYYIELKDSGSVLHNQQFLAEDGYKKGNYA